MDTSIFFKGAQAKGRWAQKKNNNKIMRSTGKGTKGNTKTKKNKKKKEGKKLKKMQNK